MNKKKWTKAVAVILLCAFMLAAPFVVLPNLPRSDLFVAGARFEGILELWHIESFEGGVGSRAGWLKRRSAAFEKQNKGCLVNVTVLTAEQAVEKLEAGERFDMASFSAGAGFNLLPYLSSYGGEISGVRADYLKGGQLNGKVYALPYMAGGYTLAAQSKNLTGFENKNLAENIFGFAFEKKVGKKTVRLASVACGYGVFNQPCLALALNVSGSRRDDLLDAGLTQYEAYEKFLTGSNHTVLLGTQRDICRLTNRIEQGRLGECVFQPVNGFTDLVQYIAVGDTTAKKAFYAEKFAFFLVGEQSQQKLTEVRMFSVTSQKLYSEGEMAELEQALSSIKTLNVFTDPSILSAMRSESLKALDTGEKKGLERYLC